MGDKSAIEWTDATWNPVVGCSLVSPGCTNCYAMTVAAGLERRFDMAKYAGLTKPSKAGPVWTGKVRLVDDALDQPLQWKRGRRIFVNSMSDLFYEDLPDDAIDQVFAVMALAPQHTFQVLTKRPERMQEYLRTCNTGGDDRWRTALQGFAGRFDAFKLGDALEYLTRRGPLPNVWLGVSVEDQKRADERIPLLLETPAAKRFLSCEPLLGPVQFEDYWLSQPTECEGCDSSGPGGGRSTSTCPVGACPLDGVLPRIDWVIVGGESGKAARPMHPDWVRQLRDQCAAAGVPFHFKQWGEWREYDTGSPDVEEVDADSSVGIDIEAHAIRPGFLTRDGRFYAHSAAIPQDVPARLLERVGKKAAGRMLDGVTHDGFPA